MTRLAHAQRGERAFERLYRRPLSCREAELALSRHVDGCLPRSERKILRRHLRDCDDCTGFVRSHRAHRSAWEALAAIPLPESLRAAPDGPAGYSGEKTG
jgi:anti-sigma factor RsiW